MPKADAALRFHRANTLRGEGMMDEALACYKEALSLNPDFIEARHNRAGVLATLGRAEEAALDYAHVLTLAPDHVPTLANLALLHGKAGRLGEALSTYDRLLSVEPGHVDALMNRGLLLAHGARFEDALRSFEAVIVMQPDHSEALNAAGHMLHRLRRFREALVHLRRAATVAAPGTSALTGLANVLTELGQHAEALDLYQRAVTMEPRNTALVYNLGGALQSLKRFNEAADVFATISNHKPPFRKAIGSALYCRLQACDWSHGVSPAAALEALERGHAVCPPFVMLALSDRPADHLLCAQAHIDTIAPAQPDSVGTLLRYGHDKVRIGYVSADFRDHAVANLAVRLFECHDRSRFEVYAFSLKPAEDSDQGRRVVAAFDRFTDLSQMTDREAAAKIREREIDIAIDLMGMTQGARPAIFSLRAAPVQVNYLGYCGTMGARYIDYIIADDVAVPRGSDDHYTEKVVRLPHSFMVRDNAVTVVEPAITRSQAGLPEHSVVFCNFAGAYKIAPAMFETWMRILQRVDGSVLWLSPLNADARKNLRDHAERLGIDSDRLVFARPEPNLADYLSRMRLADLFLDTAPCGAHATASDALWAGLPVLTIAATAFPGRVAASLLTALDMPDLIFETHEAYEEAAIGYATEPTSLQSLKDSLRAAIKSKPLFDTARFTRDFEKALVSMHNRYTTGTPTAHIHISDHQLGDAFDACTD